METELKKSSTPSTVSGARQPVHWRGLTSLVVTLDFLVLAATGVILYVTPQGRVANWTGWQVLGLSKHQWAAVHTTVALLFLIGSAFHVYFNWQALVRYVVLNRKVHLKRELAAALVLVSVVFAGTLLEVPPFGSVAVLNEQIKAHWESRSAQAPYPHAEASTLAGFSEQAGIPLAVLQERLSKSGISINDPHAQTLEDLARANGLSPTQLYARISGSDAPKGQGAGWGRQTVQSLCETSGIPVERALEALRQHGFSAPVNSTLRELAEQKRMAPADVRDLIVENTKQ